MKLKYLLLLFLQMSVFSQINQTKEKTIEFLKLNATNQNITYVKNKLFIELSKTKDSVTVDINESKLAVDISIFNKINGISSKQFHWYSKKYNPNFKVTAIFNDAEFDYFYDSNLKILTIKKFKSKSKDTIILVRFLSDFKSIVALIPEIKNL